MRGVLYCVDTHVAIVANQEFPCTRTVISVPAGLDWAPEGGVLDIVGVTPAMPKGVNITRVVLGLNMPTSEVTNTYVRGRRTAVPEIRSLLLKSAATDEEQAHAAAAFKRSSALVKGGLRSRRRRSLDAGVTIRHGSAGLVAMGRRKSTAGGAVNTADPHAFCFHGSPQLMGCVPVGLPLGVPHPMTVMMQSLPPDFQRYVAVHRSSRLDTLTPLLHAVSQTGHPGAIPVLVAGKHGTE